jgi:hypothetical protein
MEMVPYRRVPGRWPWRRRRMVAVPAVRLWLPVREYEPLRGRPGLPAGWVPATAPISAVGGDELRVRALLRVCGVVL